MSTYRVVLSSLTALLVAASLCVASALAQEAAAPRSGGSESAAVRESSNGGAQSSAKESASSKDRYALIASKNIFYPGQESASSPSSGAEDQLANPQGAGFKLTGVLQYAGRTFVVVQNVGSGESSILTVGESTGAGQITKADIAGITISTESGSFNIPVGYSLSGAKNAEPQPEQPAQAGAAQPSASQGPDSGRDRQPGSTNGSREGARNGGADSSGDQNRRGGGRGRFSPEQAEAFRNMTEEQREQMFQSMRQRRGGRSDRRDENQ